MINKQRHLDTIRELLSNDYTTSIYNDYGNQGLENLRIVLETISSIFKKVNLFNFASISIYKSEIFNLEDHVSDYNTIQNYDQLSSVEENILIIQVKNLDEVVISTSDIQISDILKTDFVYQYTSQKEVFYTLTSKCVLPKVAGTFSCFSISTFKELDEALFHYKTSIAKYAECELVKKALLPNNRIFFKPHPEYLLRDSLVYFLRIRLRGEGLEVRPEQNVDTSHPVDIKVTWGFTNHIALIEIKWIGKSLNPVNHTFSSIYTESRARDGAKQLVDYLDANKMQVPLHNSMGYLTVFDIRRRNTNESTTEISSEDALWYQNKEIEYSTLYHKIRNDFAQPIRMFITAQFTHNAN